ncbi:MAG: D-alanyl-D-alanine carboxypeptidase DacF precursor [Firmicutes bacterium ADurb.Bin506]|jgi:D-alanyl-D-alanine carboxypeptidase (penicillin-binding protein 5/6)|nr:MAG: D-alanyl-D-alanine carboxypeptidase DacF precursor [Firmicutes bacterium ADurb.Bin506]
MKGRNYAIPGVAVVAAAVVVAAIAAAFTIIGPTNVSSGVGSVVRLGRAEAASQVGVSSLVLEVGSGAVLHEADADRRIEPASLTKLMTVLLAVEAVERGRVSLADVVVVSAHAASMGGSQVWLGEGERYTLGQLLESVMVASANDSAVAVAEHIAGSEVRFVDAMNARAAALGMKSTHFENASGLPGGRGEGGGYTTARDMARLAQEVVKHEQVLKWSNTRSKVFRRSPLFILETTNPLLGTYPGCDGLKTGHTDAAGYHLIATALRGGVRLVCVVMHAESDQARAAQCAQLLDRGFELSRALSQGSGNAAVR